MKYRLLYNIYIYIYIILEYKIHSLYGASLKNVRKTGFTLTNLYNCIIIKYNKNNNILYIGVYNL